MKWIIAIGVAPKAGVYMAFRKISIMFVPDGGCRIRQVCLSRILLLSALVFVMGGALVLSWVVRDYLRLKAEIPRLTQIEKEYKAQQDQFIYLAQRIDQINEKMKELKEFDHRLKVMVNLETSEESNNQNGIGGSPPPLTEKRALLENQKELVRSMHQRLDYLDREIAIGKEEKSDLHRFLEEQKMLLASTPSIWPTRGWLSSRFGYRISPFTGQREFHKGIDISTRMNAPVVAPANGIVTKVGWDHGYGRILTISHGNGLVTRYAHLNKVLVKKGQYIKRGETIALVGNTGRSTGPHLHYEVLLNGLPTNPLRYILN